MRFILFVLFSLVAAPSLSVAEDHNHKHDHDKCGVHLSLGAEGALTTNPSPEVLKEAHLRPTLGVEYFVPGKRGCHFPPAHTLHFDVAFDRGEEDGFPVKISPHVIIFSGPGKVQATILGAYHQDGEHAAISTGLALAYRRGPWRVAFGFVSRQVEGLEEGEETQFFSAGPMGMLFAHFDEVGFHLRVDSVPVDDQRQSLLMDLGVHFDIDGFL